MAIAINKSKDPEIKWIIIITIGLVILIALLLKVNT